MIQVSNVNAVIDCQTTVLGYQEEHEISFTVSTGYDSSEDGEEKLYGNLIFAQSLNHINAEPGSYWHEEPIPRRLFEINLENLVEINPIMVNHGLTLSELTQDNNGQ